MHGAVLLEQIIISIIYKLGIILRQKLDLQRRINKFWPLYRKNRARKSKRAKTF